MGYSDTNAFAASICGIPPSYHTDMRTVDANRPHVLKTFIQQPNKAIDTAKLVGLFEYRWTTAMGLKVDCYLEYEAEFDGGRDEPSHPESITLCYALVNGVDISEVIDPDTQATIEEEALSEMRADADSHDEDRAIAQWEDRQAA